MKNTFLCAVETELMATGRFHDLAKTATGRKHNNIRVPSEERVCLNCFRNKFIETENE